MLGEVPHVMLPFQGSPFLKGQHLGDWTLENYNYLFVLGCFVSRLTLVLAGMKTSVLNLKRHVPALLVGRIGERAGYEVCFLSYLF